MKMMIFVKRLQKMMKTWKVRLLHWQSQFTYVEAAWVFVISHYLYPLVSFIIIHCPHHDGNDVDADGNVF
jgi:hypothetical protein